MSLVSRCLRKFWMAMSPVLANELVILTMRADPKPMHPAGHRQAKCAVVETNSNAVKSTISHSFEMQRRMTWISLELREIPVGYGLNLQRQSVKALPKPL